FKIEGRAKSAYYQAVVAGIYSRAVHNLKSITQKELDYFYNELYTKLVHRGYTTGFLLGEKADQNLDNSHEKSKWEFCGQVVKHSTFNTQHTTNKVLIKVHNCIKIGDKIEIVYPEYDIIKMRVDKLLNADTGKELSEAHGGQGMVVAMEVDVKVPEYSVVRRRLI
ncbi:U32 family peptidase C-terminal domain-containing protein, partial [Candidatus Parcubacteria bacterium]|nr:U32 family peptidase C-terminal domain-containing protein [Candidatus Parcubacteria bacterium]